MLFLLVSMIAKKSLFFCPPIRIIVAVRSVVVMETFAQSLSSFFG